MGLPLCRIGIFKAPPRLGVITKNKPTGNYLRFIYKKKRFSGVGDAALVSYSLSSTHQICFFGLEHGFEIHGFRLTLRCQIIGVLATRAYLLTIWLLYWERSTAHSPFAPKMVRVQFELVRHKFLNCTFIWADFKS